MWTVSSGRRWSQSSTDLPEGPLTLGEWMATWFESRRNRVALKTVENELSHAHCYFGPLLSMSLPEISAGQIEDWLAWVQRRGISKQPHRGQPHTTRICYSLLSAMLRDAVKHRLLASSPMAAVERPKVPPPRPKYLELEEVRRLIDAAATAQDPRALAVLLMACLGLRRNEALGLVWSDIDLERHVIRLRYQLGRDPDAPQRRMVRRPLKTTLSARDLRYSGELATALEEQWKGLDSPREDDFVVSLNRGLPVDPDGMTRWLSALGAAIGVKVSPHRLRHTSATLMLNAGIPLETVGKVLGHGDLRTTSMYARVLDETSFIALDSLATILSPETE